MSELCIAGADAELDTRLSGELDADNTAASGVGDQQEFTVKAEDGQGLVAGLSGWTWGTCAGIAMVWVREDSRGSGVGGRLLAAAEQVARDRGCRWLTVSSFTFQAPRFYERHGFVELARTEGLAIEGQADIHLVRMITVETCRCSGSGRLPPHESPVGRAEHPDGRIPPDPGALPAGESHRLAESTSRR